MTSLSNHPQFKQFLNNVNRQKVLPSFFSFLFDFFYPCILANGFLRPFFCFFVKLYAVLLQALKKQGRTWIIKYLSNWWILYRLYREHRALLIHLSRECYPNPGARVLRFSFSRCVCFYAVPTKVLYTIQFYVSIFQIVMCLSIHDCQIGNELTRNGFTARNRAAGIIKMLYIVKMYFNDSPLIELGFWLIC